MVRLLPLEWSGNTTGNNSSFSNCKNVITTSRVRLSKLCQPTGIPANIKARPLTYKHNKKHKKYFFKFKHKFYF